MKISNMEICEKIYICSQGTNGYKIHVGPTIYPSVNLHIRLTNENTRFCQQVLLEAVKNNSEKIIKFT
jgi:hypothetical protein